MKQLKKILWVIPMCLILLCLMAFKKDDNPELYLLKLQHSDEKIEAVCSFVDNECKTYFITLTSGDRSEDKFTNLITLYHYDNKKKEYISYCDNTYKLDEKKLSKDHFILRNMSTSDDDTPIEKVPIEGRKLSKEETEKIMKEYRNGYQKSIDNIIAEQYQGKLYASYDENKRQDADKKPELEFGILPLDVLDKATAKNGDKKQVKLVDSYGDVVAEKEVEIKGIPDKNPRNFANLYNVGAFLDRTLEEEENIDDYRSDYSMDSMSLWYQPEKREFIGFVAAEPDDEDEDDPRLWAIKLENVTIDEHNNVILPPDTFYNDYYKSISNVASDNRNDDEEKEDFAGLSGVTDADEAKEKLKENDFIEVDYQ